MASRKEERKDEAAAAARQAEAREIVSRTFEEAKERQHQEDHGREASVVYRLDYFTTITGQLA